MSTKPADHTSDRIDSQTNLDHSKQDQEKQENEEPKLLQNDDGVQEQQNDEAEGGEEEEEGECGFCLFMKGGGCKDTFIDWEKCIEEAEKNKEDIVEKCFNATAALKKCMEAHSDYYEPILRAEKAAEEEAVRELRKEAAGEGATESEKSGSSETAKPGDDK